MLRWIRTEFTELRQRLALLHGRACPNCRHRTVRRRGRKGDRSCSHCGFAWKHGWAMGPADNPNHPVNWPFS